MLVLLLPATLAYPSRNSLVINAAIALLRVLFNPQLINCARSHVGSPDLKTNCSMSVKYRSPLPLTMTFFGLILPRVAPAAWILAISAPASLSHFASPLPLMQSLIMSARVLPPTNPVTRSFLSRTTASISGVRRPRARMYLAALYSDPRRKSAFTLNLFYWSSPQVQRGPLDRL